MQSRLLKNILSVSGVLILVKALGFFKQMVIAGIFGANAETDLINLSYGFIGDIQYLLVQVMLTAVVSVYIHVKEETQNEAGQFASDTLCAGTIVVAAISATIFMLAPSYSQELSSQLGGYIRLFSPILIPLVWMAVFHALLNSNKRFIPGQLEGLYQSVILVIVIILGAPYLGVDSLVIGYWLYATFSAGFLGYQARTYLRKSSRNPFRNPQVRSLLAMVGPLSIGYGAVYQPNGRQNPGIRTGGWDGHCHELCRYTFQSGRDTDLLPLLRALCPCNRIYFAGKGTGCGPTDRTGDFGSGDSAAACHCDRSKPGGRHSPAHIWPRRI